MKEPLVLVADDDSALLQLMARRLLKLGYRVEQANDGQEALAKIDGFDFDLIVTDIYMPGVTGLDILERARVKDPHIQVVVVTASATLQNAIEALNKGAYGYLNKPFDHLSVFDNTVKRALDYRRLILDNLRMAEAQRKRGDLLEDEVTERVIRLRRRQQETVAILASLPIGVMVVEGAQKTLLRNPKAEEYLALQAAAPEKPLDDFVADARKRPVEMERLVRIQNLPLLVRSVPLFEKGDGHRALISIQKDGRQEQEVSLELQAALSYLRREMAWLTRRPLDGTTLEAVRQMQRQVNRLTTQFVSPDQTMFLSTEQGREG